MAIVVVSLGLPLLLIYLSVTGSGLAKMVKRLYFLVCCCKKSQENTEDTEKRQKQVITRLKIPLWLLILTLVCYISTGATIFCVFQDSWSFLDAFFFAFSIIWTIGLGTSHKPRGQKLTQN